MSADTSTPLDSLCDAFDVAWQGPTPPALDDYIPAAGAAGREEALFALVPSIWSGEPKAESASASKTICSAFPS